MIAAAACSESTPDVERAQPQQLPAHATPKVAAVALGVTPVAYDAAGVPRLVRGGGALRAAPAKTPLDSARLHLERLAPAWGVREGKLPELVGLAEVAVEGGRIARIEQRIDGLPIEGGELRVMIGAGGTFVAAAGTLIAGDVARTSSLFAEDDAGAVARAVAHTRGAFAKEALATKWTKRDGSRVLAGTAGDVVVELAHAKRAWFRSGETLVAAWVVEAYTSKATSTDSELWRTVVSADGRRVLRHELRTADVAFKYRVFAETTGDLRPKDGPLEDYTPHPAGAPNGTFPGYIAPVLVEVDGLNKNPQGGTDPWLPGTRTETFGNNVEAYADFNAPSGLTFGDFRATATGTRTFDRAYDTTKAPMDSQAQQMAGITSLFYVINWLHDFWYDAGFTEAAGNGQENNYGRGGEDRDAILAEAQDNALGGSRNNANMSTPRDGLPPRMQVFLWSGTETLALTAGSRTPATDSAAFGPKNFEHTAPLVLADDGTGGMGLATDACEALNAGACANKIVLVDRGNCSFKRKALNVQNAGGVGMILANNVAGTTPPGLGEDAMITTPITIGSLSVTMADGAALKSDLAAGPVTATIKRVTGPELDGSIDATLIAHEFGHYLHHRLSDCGGAMCSAMSEGWGDFLALMLLARAGDNLDGAYPFSTYTTQSFTSDPAYYGIRRAPFSTSFSINALMYRHWANGEALPTTHPFLPFGPNSEVHNAGEIWALALWDAYVALQKAGTSFEDVRKKMAKYVVSGLLLTAPDASPMEVRDSILTAIHAVSPADHDIVAAAFARRGFGSCAAAPPADEPTFVGLVESTVVAGRALVGAEATEPTTKCDEDAILDPGETMKLTIPVANHGHKALSNVTATLTSATTGISVVSATVPGTIPAYGTVNVVAEIKLEGELDAPTAGDFTLMLASDGCEQALTQPFAVRLNADDVAAASATDTFDAGTSVWTATQAETPAWSHRREGGLDGYWHGKDLGVASDTSIVSPAVTVGDAPFVVTFSHRHEFEFDAAQGGQAFDGGVVEITTDGGATWKDVTELGLTPGYTDTLDAGNALGARMAFVDKNPSHPLPDTVTLDFGTQLAGKIVQLRFRIGTDGAVGATGWEIDDVAMTGIDGTPFPAQVVNTGSCGNEPEPEPEDESGGCCDAGPIGAGNVGAAALVLAIVLRRRRRRS